ncbi:helix-turn-helix domain-containing protein [Hoeflea sp.]|uniref:helix-turn-helix domain-containing protein n=1 Tax=Hoeflea sp. TaxID=1940281 RepID=UPI003A8D5760
MPILDCSYRSHPCQWRLSRSQALGFLPSRSITQSAHCRSPCAVCKRHLNEAGTHFRELLETTRRERAKMLLSQPQTRAAQVADALGYADATAFWRAWYKWTGTRLSRRPQPPPPSAAMTNSRV